MPFIIHTGHVDRAWVRSVAPDYVVFGDNVARRGYGGQAKACRGERNAIGMPTKWAPDRGTEYYFCDSESGPGKYMIEAFDRINGALARGATVYWLAGIGEGLAEMPTQCPKLYQWMQQQLKEMEPMTSLSDRWNALPDRQKIEELGLARDRAWESYRKETEARRADRELLAAFIMECGFATGHGDTIADLISEFREQFKEYAERKDAELTGAEEIEHGHTRADEASHDHWKRS